MCSGLEFGSRALTGREPLRFQREWELRPWGDGELLLSCARMGKEVWEQGLMPRDAALPRARCDSDRWSHGAPQSSGAGDGSAQSTGCRPWRSGDSRSFIWGHVLEQRSCEGSKVLFWRLSQPALRCSGEHLRNFSSPFSSRCPLGHVLPGPLDPLPAPSGSPGPCRSLPVPPAPAGSCRGSARSGNEPRAPRSHFGLGKRQQGCCFPKRGENSA